MNIKNQIVHIITVCGGVDRHPKLQKRFHKFTSPVVCASVDCSIIKSYFLERDLKLRKKAPKLTSKNPINPSKTKIALFIPCIIFEFGSPKQTAQAKDTLCCSIKINATNKKVRCLMKALRDFGFYAFF